MSSSAIPEKINAIANNQRLLVSKQGLVVGIVASLNGGLVVSADQASSSAIRALCISIVLEIYEPFKFAKGHLSKVEIILFSYGRSRMKSFLLG